MAFSLVGREDGEESRVVCLCQSHYAKSVATAIGATDGVRLLMASQEVAPVFPTSQEGAAARLSAQCRHQRHRGQGDGAV